MDYTLDKATAVTKVSDEVFSLVSDETYWNFTSAFGGWLSAGTLKALQSRADFRGEVFSLNFTFISAVTAKNITLYINLLQRRRTMDFWRVTARDDESDGKVLFTADIISGTRRESDLAYNAEMPAYKPLEQSIRLEPNPMAPRWIKLFDLYLGEGVPFKKNPSGRSILHIREADGRPLDAQAIVTFVDTPMPRTFFLEEGLRMASTLSMSTHIYACEAEIDSVGTDYLILVADCATVRHSLYNQECRVFRQDGLLLASSYQTAFFK
ncbi:thioesterase family protein [Parvularcula sp. IMCC14364]|uniref:thioesterase family protein n=1 Tax=Parvularcula sp. IMCC14364 TaxID=3067902 RepID=UPI002741A523|nr:thioesterase family protein [Parvularcula sp. IMCC14364]